jgi:dolichol-phosphate mannosyltransferase
MKTELQIILPVHNEEESIEKTIKDICISLSGISFQIIVCEDGSIDGTKKILVGLSKKYPLFLNMSEKRKGYSNAVCDGVSISTAQYILCIESDGQCNMSDFVKFWKNRGSNKILIGWRINRADSLIRIIFSRFFYIIYQCFFNVKIHDPSCPFVLTSCDIAKSIAKDMKEMKEGFWWEFIARAKLLNIPIEEIPINHRIRHFGKTQVYKIKKMPGIFFNHVMACFKIKSEYK